MNGFKLLGIRPFLNCSDRFSKNLQKGVIYKFHQDYHFLDKDGKLLNEENLFIKDKDGKTIDNDVYSICKNKEILDDIYSVTTLGGHKIDVQVSALVGKNGSGKSTLLELLYGVCYIIALKKGIITDHSELIKLINNKNIDHNKLFRKINEIQDVYTDLMVEVYYEIDGKCFSIWHNSQQEIIHRSLSEGFKHDSFNEYGVYSYDDSLENRFNYVFNEFFFYTISINYSLYGLNSKFNNSWLNDLFHKNDGYQTPLVINPFRQDGNIDVNSELHLAQSRLLSNLVDDNFIDKRIVNDKKVEKVIFELDYNNYNTFGAYDFEMVYEKLKEKLGLNNSDFITTVYNALYTNRSNRISKISLENISNSEILVKYVYRKILKIHSNYEEYRLLDTRDINTIIPSFLQVFKGLIKLRKDKSHITLKLRQILNSIRFNTLKDGNGFKWIEESDDHQKVPNKIKKYFFNIDIVNFIDRIKQIKNEFPNFEIIELVPAACFRPNLFIKNRDDASSVSNFNGLSSGEQHFIHSLQSVFYHIINLNSVFLSTNQKIKYNYINLVFDEIELYYHPEFQRKFVFEILRGISNLKIEFIKGINILFLTHSPFILSDIHSQNVLRLNEGKPQDSNNLEQTFGANIYDLLDNEFFMKDGFIGEHAMFKIKEVLDYVSGGEYNETKHSYFLSLTSIIGDEIINQKLNQLLNDLYISSIDENQRKIIQLKLKQKQIEDELKRLEE